MDLIVKTKGLLPRQIARLTRSNLASLLIDSQSSAHETPLPWERITGIDEIKRQLEESILWPIKFEHLFARNKLPLATGVLLCGGSGTGKTLVGRAFANMLHRRHGVNVVRVAGPSLLGKYVGSSERAVRDVFERARQQRPALVLLEEVDALAPRRGSDNTGSTDRVVNQLLTELDGTGDRSGIHVLAISSPSNPCSC